MSVSDGRLENFICAARTGSNHGVAVFDEIGPRLLHYIFKMGRAGFSIDKKDRNLGGAFAGKHGRYVLRLPVTVPEGAAS